jgi:dihydrofolate reductase
VSLQQSRGRQRSPGLIGNGHLGIAVPTPILLIAAVAENGVIGSGNALPWRLRSDMQNFRALTMGKPVIMGRKTFLSIGKPLRGRTPSS